MLVRPEKLGVVVCPNDHSGEELLVFPPQGEGQPPMEFFVIRMVHFDEHGHVHHYFYPPVQFILALAWGVKERNPSVLMAVTHKRCASCMGYHTPELHRKKYRERPWDPDVDGYDYPPLQE